TVPGDAQARDDPVRHGSGEAVPPELLPRVNVGDVHLHQRRGQLSARVTQGDRVVRPCGSVEDHGPVLLGGFVQPLDHVAFVVGLAHLDLEPDLGRGRPAVVDQVVVGRLTVDVRFTGAETVEIRPVEDQHVHSSTFPVSPGSPDTAEYAAA